MKKQPVLVGMFVSLLLAIGLPLITDGLFVYVILSVIIVLLSIILMVGAGAIFMLSSWKGSETLRRRSMKLLSISLVGIMQWASIPVVNYLSEKQLAAARSYCESLVPELKRFKLKHGNCPERIDELPVYHAAPAFLRNQKFLSVRDSSGSVATESCEFSFQFRLPSSPPLVIHRYDSVEGTWKMDD